MNVRRFDALAFVTVTAAAGLSVALYGRLPVRMATHFDLAGNPNGWMPRAVGAAFLPAVAVVLWAVIRFGPRALPASEQRRLPEGQRALFAALTASFVVVVHAMLLYVAVVPGAEPTRAVWIAAGALFVALGLALPRVRRNALVGVRTPWTLQSDENWARTQRLGGGALVLAGIVAAVAGVVGGAVSSIVAIAALVAAGVVPSVYSLLLARKSDAQS